MAAQFVARPYRYADNVPWNEDRYEIFFWYQGEWIPVGGAIRTWSYRTIAFVCNRNAQRLIRNPGQAADESGGRFVWGQSVGEALKLFRETFPDPITTLSDAQAEAYANF
jgi:hypothetical protein